jgi:spermidine synthase
VYEIVCNGVFLMASYNEPSARALARLALARLPVTHTDLLVLVAGLGMGYTLASALADPRVGRVDMVEIEPLIIQWNRDHLGGLAGNPAADLRVRLVTTDLVRFLWDSQVVYDALLLDADNGPDWLAIDTNVQLYDRIGLDRLKSRLTAGGVLAIWSADMSPQFVERLRTVFSNATAAQVTDSIPESGEIIATIYLAYD